MYEWDEDNLAELAFHHVTPGEAIEALEGRTHELPYRLVKGEFRFAEIGQTLAGRILRAVWTPKGKKIRIVTAFEPGSYQKRLYREHRE